MNITANPIVRRLTAESIPARTIMGQLLAVVKTFCRQEPISRGNSSVLPPSCATNKNCNASRSSDSGAWAHSGKWNAAMARAPSCIASHRKSVPLVFSGDEAVPPSGSGKPDEIAEMLGELFNVDCPRSRWSRADRGRSLRRTECRFHPRGRHRADGIANRVTVNAPAFLPSKLR